MTTRSKSGSLMVAVIVILLAGCQPTGSGAPTGSSPTADAAAAYCAQSGGTVETRYPFYGINGPDPLQLAGSLPVCAFTAADGSRIFIALDTLYTDQPTLAASAYLAKVPLASGQPAGDPSSFYCTQLGGTDAFGGVNAAGGGWAKADASDVVALCIFPDLSSIDSWGLTYHSDGTIRGADLTDLLRYKPAQAPQPTGPVGVTPEPLVTPMTEGTLTDVTITLERTACFGTCPVYKLTITGDGTVVYEGRDFVQVKGQQTSKISPAQVQDLVDAFEQADFLTLTDYMEQQVTDLPYAMTSITMRGQTKTVQHYYGDNSAPQKLTDLESKIDEIVNSKQWTGK